MRFMVLLAFVLLGLAALSASLLHHLCGNSERSQACLWDALMAFAAGILAAYIL